MTFHTRGGTHPGYLHDVGGNDSLVVLAPCDLTQVEQVPDDGYKEPVFLLLQHGTADRPNGPTERVEPTPR